MGANGDRSCSFELALSHSRSKMPPKIRDLDAYAARLYARRLEAVMLTRVEVNLDGWKPKANECHQNASEIHRRNSLHTAVRGWLYFDFGGSLDRVQFLAHSAVRTPDGELCDVTPSNASQEYPYVPAEESEEEYAALIQEGVTRLWHLK